MQNPAEVPESSDAAAVREFVAAFPDARAAWNEHLKDNDGEPLSHLFFEDVSRIAAEIARRRDADGARRLADALEAMAQSSDPDVLNVIDVSFVECFVWGTDEDQALLEWLKPFFGPAMHQRIREFVEYSEQLYESARKKPRQKFKRRVKGLWRRRG